MSRQTHLFFFALSIGLQMTATNALAYPSEKGEADGIVDRPHKSDIGPVDGLRTARRQFPDNVTATGCPGVAILNADPADGTTDARQPFGPADDPTDPAARQGIGSAGEPIVLSLDVVGLGAECFAVCESNPDAVLGANAIASVTEGPAGVYTIVLEHAIAPGEWTNILVGERASVAYLSLPADSNADGLSNANDVLARIDMLNGAVEPPFGIFSMDIDHSGASNASDILRIIDLLNGGGNLEIWLGAAAPDNECGPPECGPGAGDCCEDNGEASPGCDDADCCDCVCTLDPFCCDNTWDFQCSIEACGDLGSPCELVCDCCPGCGDGACNPGETCKTCPDDCAPCCGDGTCDPDEDCATCTQDCGPCCGNGLCDPDEDCVSCPEDCGPCCGNGSCDPDEDCASCPKDCGHCECPGAGDCCEDNGEASPGCDDAACCDCVCTFDPFCCFRTWDLVCAREACGDHGSPCLTDCDCGPCCGNGTCDVTENCVSCPQDCGPCCGNGSCDPDEDCESCTVDCGPCCGNGSCDPDEDCEICPKDCGPCPPCPGDGDCCAEGGNGSPGCDDTDCCECICACDPFCCETIWDPLCAGSGQAGGCGASSPNGPCVEPCAECLCGNGSCDPNEDCESCPEDCGPCPPCPGDGGCCEDNGPDSPGCDDTDCCECVCSINSFCCDNTWDSQCAKDAAILCVEFCPECATCGNGDCCVDQGPDSPGCDNLECCVCVCAIDPFCCGTTWDRQCAGDATGECLGACPECLTCGFPGTGDCLQFGGNGTPFCDDEVCCNQVCDDDSFCCTDEWDGFCASNALANCPGGGGGCCDPNPTPGCQSEDCLNCVCANDGFCCQSEWDSVCAGVACAACQTDCDCCPGPAPIIDPGREEADRAVSDPAPGLNPAPRTTGVGADPGRVEESSDK